MKLKSLVVVGLLALASSCTNQSNLFYISKFYPLGPGCDIEANRESSISPNGYLDVAAGNPQFYVGLEITGAQNVQQRGVVIGQTTLEQPNRNRPIITRQIVTYTLSKRLGATPKPFETALFLPFSDNGEIFGSFQLISPELGQSLFDGLTPSENISDDFVDLTVEVEFRGEYNNSRSPFTTGTATMPIRVYRSNPAACANGYQRFGVDPSTGDVDQCDYVGQSSYQVFTPSKPTCCPAMGAPGC